MKRAALVSAAAAVAVLLAVFAAGLARPAPTAHASTESQAKAVAKRFVRTLNTKHFEQACNMMSARFYRENHVPSHARCVLGFRVGFMGMDKIRFKILGVRVSDDRAVVHATADGNPGRMVLIQEHGAFKVLSLAGSGS